MAFLLIAVILTLLAIYFHYSDNPSEDKITWRDTARNICAGSAIVFITMQMVIFFSSEKIIKHDFHFKSQKVEAKVRKQDTVSTLYKKKLLPVFNSKSSKVNTFAILTSDEKILFSVMDRNNNPTLVCMRQKDCTIMVKRKFPCASLNIRSDSIMDKGSFPKKRFQKTTVLLSFPDSSCLEIPIKQP